MTIKSKFANLKELRSGKVFDIKTIRGQVKSLIFCVLSSILLWNAHLIIIYFDSLFGFKTGTITEGSIRIQHFWAITLGGISFFLISLNIIFIYLAQKFKK